MVEKKKAKRTKKRSSPKKKKKETKQKKGEMTKEESELMDSYSTKMFFVGVALIIIIAGILLFVVPLINTSIPEETVDELHQDNLEGKEDPETNYVYNGFSFAKADDVWYSKVTVPDSGKVYEIAMRYGPKELEDVELIGDIGRYNYAYAQSPTKYHMYLTFDPNKDFSHISLSLVTIMNQLGKIFNLGFVTACATEHESCNDVPLINCENTDKPVIFLTEEPGTKVELKDNCITLQGEDFEVVRATERFLYQWYGIMS